MHAHPESIDMHRGMCDKLNILKSGPGAETFRGGEQL